MLICGSFGTCPWLNLDIACILNHRDERHSPMRKVSTDIFNFTEISDFNGRSFDLLLWDSAAVPC